jgi:hypothetical protein
MPTCKFSNSCLDCMECERPDFINCKAFIAYSTQELKQTAGGLFYEAEPDLFNNENDGGEND